MIWREQGKKLLKTAAIWLLSTLFSLVLAQMGLRVENLLLVYVVGVLIGIVETSSLCWGIASAVAYVLTFNFLFTEPKHSFIVNDPNYYVSFGIFAIVAFIVATLTIRLQNQMRIATEKEEVTKKLGDIGRGFLNVAGRDQIAEYGSERLSNILGKNVKVYFWNQGEELEDSAARWCVTHSMACGCGTSEFSNRQNLYLPICNRNKTYGAIAIDCRNGPLKEEARVYVDNISYQMMLVLERERLNREKEETRLQVEKEKLKSTLLRSISHDLRTPLTGIAGGANFLYNNLDCLDGQTMKSMLWDMMSDAEWLSSMVENLLNMTRIQEGRLVIKKKNEVVDDILAAAVSLVSRRKGSHSIKTAKPEDILLVPADGQLLVQVLVNLMDNAIRHTRGDSEIVIQARKQDQLMVFEVSDNGGGIDKEKIAHIFDNFFTTAEERGDMKRGVGLGLAICKAIVEAHRGHIYAGNNDKGGATFRVELPMEDKENE